MESKPNTPTNTAAWLAGSTVTPLVIKAAPYTPPRENEIVIRSRAVAINPYDRLVQDMGDAMPPAIKYPFVMGTDVAGEVAEVGKSVSRFQIGDRVVGHAPNIDPKSEPKVNASAGGAFQLFCVLPVQMVSHIPEALSFERAAVLPLGLSTAACGLFQKDHLALQYPTVPRSTADKTLLIWGGSTSVGSNAIQLAVAAGYSVITTATPKNFDYVRSLGASQAFDYNSKTAVADITNALKGKKIAGALAIGSGAAEACMQIIPRCEGDRFISMASFNTPQTPSKYFGPLSTVASFMSFAVYVWIKSKILGFRSKFIFAGTIVTSGVGKAVYEDFLPKALAEEAYIAAPDPFVVGKGLEHIQTGLDLQKKGVSARKLVISL